LSRRGKPCKELSGAVWSKWEQVLLDDLPGTRHTLIARLGDQADAAWSEFVGLCQSYPRPARTSCSRSFGFGCTAAISTKEGDRRGARLDWSASSKHFRI